MGGGVVRPVMTHGGVVEGDGAGLEVGEAKLVRAAFSELNSKRCSDVCLAVYTTYLDSSRTVRSNTPSQRLRPTPSSINMKLPLNVSPPPRTSP